jgi:thiol-disulfide isomerase/thioredoxin
VIRKHWPKIKEGLVFIAGAALIGVLVAYTVGPSAGRIKEGTEVPNAKLFPVQTDQAPITVADLKGKGVVLTFWEDWCSACRKEMPLFQTLHKKYASERFAIIGVTRGGRDPRTRARMRDLLAQKNVTYPNYWELGHLSRKFNVRSIPFTLFVGPDGKVVGDVTGSLSERDAKKRVEALIELADRYEGDVEHGEGDSIE